MRHKKFFLIAFSLLLIMLICVSSVNAANAAAVTNFDFGINRNLTNIILFTENVGTMLASYARSLFLGLATLSLFIGLARMILSGESNIGAVAAHLAKWVIYVSIFLWIMSNMALNKFIPKIIVNSFQQLGEKVIEGSNGGYSTTFAPDDMLNTGIRFAGDMWEKATKAGVVESLVMGLLIILFFIIIALIAAHVAIALIEMHIVIYGGVILIGFGGLEYTRDIALNYLKYSISIGIKILVIMIVYALAFKLLQECHNDFKNIQDMKELLTFILQTLGGILCMYLAITMVPAMAQSIVTGAASSFGHSLITTPAKGAIGMVYNLIKSSISRGKSSGSGQSRGNERTSANNTTFRGGSSGGNATQRTGSDGTTGRAVHYPRNDSRSSNDTKLLTGRSTPLLTASIQPALPDFRRGSNNPPSGPSDKPDSPKGPKDSGPK